MSGLWRIGFMEYIFPFEKVSKNSRIVIWGIGCLGKKYVEQIQATEFCKIIAIVDSKFEQYEGILINGHIIQNPRLCSQFEFDYIVIAIDSENVTNEIVKTICDMGINEEKIVTAFGRYLKNLEISEDTSLDAADANERIRIKIINQDGIGDALFDLYLIKAFRELYKDKISIDFVSKYEMLFETETELEAYSFEAELPDIKYDLVLVDNRIMTVRFWKENRLKDISNKIWAYCVLNKKVISEVFSNRFFRGQVNLYSKTINKKRYEQSDLAGVFAYSETYLQVSEKDTMEILSRFDLEGRNYITVNRGEGHRNSNSPKLWPKKNYDLLVQMIKERFPNYLIVQLGSDEEYGTFEGIDINLCGKTTLRDIKYVIKGASLHIDNEGGLVHLRHMLGGKSVVLFGPTEIETFGYVDNINIRVCNCKEACSNYSQNWFNGCILSNGIKSCMDNISVDMVFDRVKDYLQSVEEK